RRPCCEAALCCGSAQSIRAPPRMTSGQRWLTWSAWPSGILSETDYDPSLETADRLGRLGGGGDGDYLGTRRMQCSRRDSQTQPGARLHHCDDDARPSL